MNFIGVDLHKESITICVMDEKRKVLRGKHFACTQTDEIVEFCRQFRPFKVVVEATASYVGSWSSSSPWPRRSCWPIPRSCG